MDEDYENREISIEVKLDMFRNRLVEFRKEIERKYYYI